MAFDCQGEGGPPPDRGQPRALGQGVTAQLTNESRSARMAFAVVIVRQPIGVPFSDCQRSLSQSEEHTSELQSLTNLVCRLLLEKKKTNTPLHHEPPTCVVITLNPLHVDDG